MTTTPSPQPSPSQLPQSQARVDAPGQASLPSQSRSSQTDGDARLSYKFQRLREKLRQAIASGELSGKLPGERQLARRFRVNAKTLSKALTDLAAEGLLERSIGRGTFVKGASSDASSDSAASTTAGTAAPAAERWLLVCDPIQARSEVVRKITAANPLAQVVHDTRQLRPSFLSAFRAVIDFGADTPVSFLRDMVVRNVAVVLVGREPTTYSMNAVLVDRTLGASVLARDMMLDGHRRFVAVERRGSTYITSAIRKAAQRYAPDASVDPVYPEEAVGAVEQGATALICDSTESAARARADLEKAGFAIPGQVSLAAIGSGDGDWPCSGYYVLAEQKAQAVLQALHEATSRRPTTLWLTGSYYDANTTGPIEGLSSASTASVQSHAGVAAMR